MYIVRFIRVDGKQHEDYFYNEPFGAIHHLKLFAKDDSNLYQKIQLIFLENCETEIVVTELLF